MEHQIKHICETQTLLLSWEAPVSFSDRTRWVVGELTRTVKGAQFRYLDGDEFCIRNNGRSQAELRAAGFRGYPAFELRDGGEKTFCDGVLEAFARRLPPRSRPDFPRYLEYYHIDPTLSLSSWTLLGLTEARLPGDWFSLIDPLDPGAECCDLMLEVAGHRHYAEVRSRLYDGIAVGFAEDPSNTYDENAVRVVVGADTIGYVNRLQSATVRHWMTHRSLKSWVVRLNGSPERPRAYIFVEVRPHLNRVAA